MDLLIRDHLQEGRKGDHPHAGTDLREFSAQLFEQSREQTKFHMIMAADLKRGQLLMAAQPFSCGKRGLQDQLRVWQEEHAFLGERNAFAGSPEQSDIKLFFQGTDLGG